MFGIYNSFFSDIYLFISFFLLFTASVFLNLSKLQNFPNIYVFTCVFIIIFLVNIVIIDNSYNNFYQLNSYDLFKYDNDLVIKFIIIVLTIIFFIYSYYYIKKMKLNLFEFSMVIYFVVLSFNFFIYTIDLLSFYLLLEIQSLCFYMLTAFNKHNQYSVESGLKYFILSSFSSISLLFGYSFIYGMTGTLTFSDIFLFFSNIDNDVYFSNSYLVASLLILVAFLFKLYIAPFHLWISDIYQGAPTMTTAYFATVTSLPLFYVLVKCSITFLYWIEWPILFSILSISSMILGLIGALYQKKIKRLIAFSSVSNIGYLIIAFVQENPQTLSYSFTYFLLYILNTVGLFLIFLNLYIFKFNFFLERFTFFYGFFNKNKGLSLCLIILFFTAAGIPPFSLFFLKTLILIGLSYNFYSILLFVLVFSSILSSFYYLRIIKVISFDYKKQWLQFNLIHYSYYIILIYIVAINFFFFKEFKVNSINRLCSSFFSIVLYHKFLIFFIPFIFD